MSKLRQTALPMPIPCSPWPHSTRASKRSPRATSRNTSGPTNAIRCARRRAARRTRTLTSTELDAVADSAATVPARSAAGAGDGWHAPPSRAVRLHAGCMALLFLVIASVSMVVPLIAADRLALLQRVAGAILAILLSAVVGAYLGARLRHQRWKLDDEGLW